MLWSRFKVIRESHEWLMRARAVGTSEGWFTTALERQRAPELNSRPRGLCSLGIIDRFKSL